VRGAIRNDRPYRDPVKEFETRFPEIGRILELMRGWESDRCRSFQRLADGTLGKLQPRKF
jgi:hypothetical protein